MNMKNTVQSGMVKRKRTLHHKSRNGCLECKRRRVKCDETKPSCLRCALSLDKCEYAAQSQPVLQEPFQINTSSPDIFSPSPCLSSPLPFPPSSSPSLYQHYIQHTHRTLSLARSNTTVPVSIHFLASHSPTIFHALLAVSAASLAWTMISTSPHADVSTVQSTMFTGYAHYNLASQAMRRALADEAQEALVASVILVPFAAGSQQINHWLSRRTGHAVKEMASTPRDVIVLVRGIRTMLGALEYVDLHTEPNWMSETGLGDAASRTHIMSEIIAETSKVAFGVLRGRLEDLEGEKVALEAAFDTLEIIREGTLKVPEDAVAAEWKVHSTEVRTRNYLTFLSQVPQEYLDIVLPLLDQRLESPRYDSQAVLTPAQALALDIYAHWSVLMFLVGDQSWFIGDLPVVTLQGMMNRYGEGFAGRSSFEVAPETKWWPASMLRIWEDIKSYRLSSSDRTPGLGY